MERTVLAFTLCIILSLAGGPARADFNDHRGHDTDSLENVVAGWTEERLAGASDEQYEGVLSACKELMWGYLQVNGERSAYFARKALALATARNYLYSMADAERMLGMQEWGRERNDSALAHYRRALALAGRIAAGEPSGSKAAGYDESTVDDLYSAIYGAMGNAYNTMDSIPKAMEYYAKAGEIFERRGWNESNAILWYNIGETWLEENDFAAAKHAYEKSLRYAEAAGDSLLRANAYKGLGGMYLDMGRTSRALKYLKTAEEYYGGHADEEMRFRMENLDFMQQVLTEQKKQIALTAACGFALVLALAVLMLALRRVRELRRRSNAADAVIGEALEELGASGAGPGGRAAPAPGAVPELSEREKEILPLIAAGFTSPQIADKLCLSIPTIKWYRKKLFIKFDALNSADLIFKAKESGVI